MKAIQKFPYSEPKSPEGKLNTLMIKNLTHVSLIGFRFNLIKKTYGEGHHSASMFSGAISRTQLSRRQTAEKERLIEANRKKISFSPEVVNLDSDSDEPVILKETVAPKKLDATPIERPRAQSQDYDVIQLLDKYAPKKTVSKGATKPLPVKKFNSLEQDNRRHHVTRDDYLEVLTERYSTRARETERKIREETVKAENARERNSKLEKCLEARLKKHLSITEVAIEEPEEEEEGEELPGITPQMEAEIQRAISSRGETLIDKFSIPITKHDVATLLNLNWLNDEIVNFYMNLIVERSKKMDNWPKVYAFNTFFYPKITEKGHSAVKRWTRKVDIFSHDLLLVPVHLGMHWCLATVDLREKRIDYFDSMHGNNPRCHSALLQYLQDEHLDKKKSPLDTSGFQLNMRKDIPTQENGSDCGMFTCKFAEYLSRDAEITFSQALLQSC